MTDLNVIELFEGLTIRQAGRLKTLTLAVLPELRKVVITSDRKPTVTVKTKDKEKLHE